MSKSRKTLLTSSLAMLIAASIALSTATYAWFTSGKTATVSGMEFTAQTSSGILVSVDGKDWKSSLDNTDLSSSLPAGGLLPVSSAGTVDSGVLKLYEGTMGTDGKLTSKAATVATSAAPGYYKFDLYFKNSGSDDLDLYLCHTARTDKTDGTNCSASTVEDKADATASPKIEDKDTSLAIRVGTIGHTPADTPTSTDNGTSCSIWEPNAKTHTTTAKNQRHEIDASGAPVATASAKVDAQVLKYVGLNDTTSSGTEFTLNAEGNVEVVKTTDTPAKERTKIVTTVNDADMSIVTLTANKVTKVTFYIWLEGQDADCQNDISAGIVKVALNFYAIKKST